MKKILCIIVSCLFCVAALSAQKEYVIDHVEEQMILPDGAVADVAFFKKFKDGKNYAKAKKSKIAGKRNISHVAEKDTDLGYNNIYHKENENAYIQKICDVMKENGLTYGIAYVDFDSRTRQYSFEYYKKGHRLDSDVGELRNTFIDYFTPDDLFLKAFFSNPRQEDVMKKLNFQNADKMEDELLANLLEMYGQDSEAFKSELYRARHESRTISPDGIDIEVYFIYDDRGYCYSTSYGSLLAVDRNGSFWLYDYDRNCERIASYKVDEKVNEAAQKSLE